MKRLASIAPILRSAGRCSEEPLCRSEDNAARTGCSRHDSLESRRLSEELCSIELCHAHGVVFPIGNQNVKTIQI